MPTKETQKSNKIVDHRQFLQLMASSLALEELDFMGKAIQEWLTVFPGDLQVYLLQACHLFATGKKQRALQRLTQLFDIEPSFLAAYLTYAQFNAENPLVNGVISALGGETKDERILPVWAPVLRSTFTALAENSEINLQSCVDDLLHFSGENALIDLAHLLYAMRMQPDEAVLILARLYHERWPKCLQFKLVLADHAMRMGDEILGLELLQNCSKRDLSGLSAKRLWGEDHSYQKIWPAADEITFELRTGIPDRVLFRMGWNQLAAGTPEAKAELWSADQHDLAEFEHQLKNNADESESNAAHQRMVTSNEEVLSIFEQVSRSLGKKNIRKVEGRFPMYVVMTSKQALKMKYGSESTDVIIAQMNSMVGAVKQRPGWSGMVYIPDDESIMNELGLKLRNQKDPWDLKLGLLDLDQYLAKKGAMIGAILIIGGNEIIPFHQLPNPTDDSDLSVFSDNPYASIDENYFVPELPIGRMPDENSADPGLLLMQLRGAMKQHRIFNKNVKTPTSSMAFPWETLVEFLMALFGNRKPGVKINSLGYSAAIWRRSSIAAYRPIGSANLVAISPPKTSKTIDRLWLSESEFAYFNLHGIEDGAEWFGQKDFVDGSNGPDYPIALQPGDIKAAPKYQQVVFSEACYGAHVERKTVDQSNALKFLATGCKGFIGSTEIAYGSIQPPLIGADLLAFLFWKRLQEGHTTGDALMRAKIELAKEMQKRQNFLDGEDQKTLLSFVLYGDPLIQAVNQDVSKVKRIEREKVTDELMIFSETDVIAHEPMRISDKTIADVKQVLSAYLPGLADSDYELYQQFILDTDDSIKKFRFGAPEKLKRHESGNVVMAFRKDVEYQNEHHQYYAKATVDLNGRLIKLAVSR